MYICADCSEISRPGEKINKVTLQTRRAVYKDITGRQIAEGNEIVREKGICLRCYEKVQQVPKEQEIKKFSPRQK